MMTRAQLRKMLIDLAVMLVLSIMVISLGIYISYDKSNIREQQRYKALFGNVVKASSYEELKHDLVKETEGVNHVYLAYDREGRIIGYIADISVFDSEGRQLHSYVGINSDGSTIIGYKRINDEEDPIPLELNDIGTLSAQVMGKQMPIALSKSGFEDVDVVYSDYNPPAGLQDGTYYAQSLTKDKKGYIDYVEIEISDGRIKRVVWDGINIDPTTGSRNQASLTGAYVISGENWATQCYNVCHALIELQDVSRLAMKSDGTTEIIPGVTTNISAFVDLANECLDNSKAGFDKDQYLDTLCEIITSQGVDPESKKDSNGFIVYPFEDLSYFKKDGAPDTDLKTVYETTLTDDELTGQEGDDTEVTVTPKPASSPSSGGEDGIATDPYSSIISNSIDGIPLSEVRTFIQGINYDMGKSSGFISTINTTYKFFREYMNWIG